MISPPPGSAADFAAYKTFAMLKKPSFFIFIGELGGGDGMEGSYNELLGDDSDWNLVSRTELSSTITPFGDECKKEIFIFSLKMNVVSGKGVEEKKD
jgi:hypothetical protein